MPHNGSEQGCKGNKNKFLRTEVEERGNVQKATSNTI